MLWYYGAMRILAIETSCDETGISVLEYDAARKEVSILGNALASQIAIHAEYGGVFPALAKRAHAEKITFLLEQALSDAELLEAVDAPLTGVEERIAFLDEKESLLKEGLSPFLTYYKAPAVDYIAVTVGPGLEPALWVGVNTAKALSTIWGIPVIPINHMEGHFVTAVFLKKDEGVFALSDIEFPALALLVSGGHTELVTAEAFGTYQKIGQTRDDAVGEAFDKVARILGLPYPGGPAVSALAQEWRQGDGTTPFDLPRPMLHSKDYDFSFSGIKTAVLYGVRDLTEGNTRELTEDEKRAIACEFETAAIEVLVKKTLNAIQEYGVRTVIVGGGVAGNTYLRNELTAAIRKHTPDTTVLFPEPWLATDNAIMIGLAAMTQAIDGQIKTSALSELKADGNLSL